VTHRDKARAQALEYARSQGWLPPEAVEKFIDERAVTRNEAEAGADAMRIASLEADVEVFANARIASDAQIADLEAALAARGPHLKKRITALESALGALLSMLVGTSAEDEEPVKAAKALLS
jgi:hypothetical protein